MFSGLIEKLKSRFDEYNSRVNWFVFCLIFTFTTGSWLDLDGLWCELPIMVAELPEGWRLPSILSIAIQISQIGPIIFLTGKYFLPRIFTYKNTNYFILILGAVSCLLLAFFWKKTAHVFGQEHSVGLIILNFSFSILDSTSSLTFLPYVGKNFVKEYMIPQYIGEALGALIASSLSLIQGLGQDPGCSNYTDLIKNQTYLQPNNIKPNFSVMVYFIILFLVLCLSVAAFYLLNNSNIALNERKVSNNLNLNSKNSETDLIKNKQSVFKKDNKERIFLLAVAFLISFLIYGILPGIQSYSALPYGNYVYNLAVNLGFLFMPISLLASIWSYDASLKRILIEFLIKLCFAVYIIVLSFLSPCPPLLDSWFGSFLIIISWIICQCMAIRVRCLICTRLEKFGPNSLLAYGVITAIAQVIGGVLVFVIVNFYSVFKEKPQCVFDHNLYC